MPVSIEMWLNQQDDPWNGIGGVAIGQGVVGAYNIPSYSESVKVEDGSTTSGLQEPAARQVWVLG